MLRQFFEPQPERRKALVRPTSLRAFGDKSPDFYRSPQLVTHLAENYPLIYTVRDPRAIYCSIMRQQDASEQEKQERWADLAGNFLAWERHLDRDNVLCIRYEDLLTNPGETMASVYHHLGLEPSLRFLEPFARTEPSRFLWRTAVDWESGIGREFDTNRTEAWRQDSRNHTASRRVVFSAHWLVALRSWAGRHHYTDVYELPGEK
jgi:hypothetical protein